MNTFNLVMANGYEVNNIFEPSYCYEVKVYLIFEPS
jgi:hypothetical protein